MTARRLPADEMTSADYLAQQRLPLPGVGKSRRNMAPEAQLVRAVLELLTVVYGCYVWRANTGAGRIGERFVRFGPPGQSDVIGVGPGGRFIAVECKNEHGKLSEDQRDFLALVEAHGGIALVVRPQTYVEVIEQALKGEG